jgi:hypothetical protein
MTPVPQVDPDLLAVNVEAFAHYLPWRCLSIRFAPPGGSKGRLSVREEEGMSTRALMRTMGFRVTFPTLLVTGVKSDTKSTMTSFFSGKYAFPGSGKKELKSHFLASCYASDYAYELLRPWTSKHLWPFSVQAPWHNEALLEADEFFRENIDWEEHKKWRFDESLRGTSQAIERLLMWPGMYSGPVSYVAMKIVPLLQRLRAAMPDREKEFCAARDAGFVVDLPQEVVKRSGRTEAAKDRRARVDGSIEDLQQKFAELQEEFRHFRSWALDKLDQLGPVPIPPADRVVDGPTDPVVSLAGEKTYYVPPVQHTIPERPEVTFTGPESEAVKLMVEDLRKTLQIPAAPAAPVDPIAAAARRLGVVDPSQIKPRRPTSFVQPPSADPIGGVGGDL